MTKKEMLTALNNAGITICLPARMHQNRVKAYYDARFPKEEKTMKTIETVPAETTTKSVSAPDRYDIVFDNLPPFLQADVYPNLGDWVKIRALNPQGKLKTVLEARFGKNSLRVQVAEKTAATVGGEYKLVKSFSKPATYFLPYDAEGVKMLATLGAAAVAQF